MNVLRGLKPNLAPIIVLNPITISKHDPILYYYVYSRKYLENKIEQFKYVLFAMQDKMLKLSSFPYAIKINLKLIQSDNFAKTIFRETCM